jgi:trans-2,3-dihydro-3-hydroxyanthranilate isomerase
MSHRFHIVDVFAEALYAGNPLAVVCDAGDLDRETMQRIAREFGFSETTFVTSPASEAGTAVRIFTPAEELPFAGHPTLGTAWVIREHLLRGGADALTLVLGVGRVPVAFTPEPGGGELVWLTAPPVSLERRLAPAQIAPALGLADSEIRVDLPGPEVRAGVHQLLVPLTSHAAVRRARLDPAAFAPLRAQGFPDHVYLFARETEGPAISSRAHVLHGGAREDPATGSAPPPGAPAGARQLRRSPGAHRQGWRWAAPRCCASR